MEKKRIAWVDYAKAFAIFCVVFGHIEVFSMHGYDGFWHRFQNLYCMPLFFFLSGMFAKPQQSVAGIAANLRRKAVQLLPPFVVTGSLYTYLCLPGRPWWSLFWWPEGGAHNGYWFVWALFEIYLIFSLCQFASVCINRYRGTPHGGGIFLTSAVLAWLALQALASLKWVGEPWYTILSYGRLPYNFPFFVAGHYLMQHRGLMERVFNAKAASWAVALFLPLYIVRDKFGLKLWPLAFPLIACFIVSLIYALRTYGEHLPCRRWAGYAGRHTLDIYVLHYFFLPKNLDWLNAVLGLPKDQNISVELTVCGIMALLVVVITLGAARIIDMSKPLRLLILGKKN